MSPVIKESKMGLFRKNVQVVGAIMRLIHFCGGKKGSHRLEELLLFWLHCVDSGRS